MALTFPRDLCLEAYLGRWVEITALAEGLGLRQVEPVTVTWGLPNEQAKALAPPSTVEGVLNNSGGHWTPGNPMSDYYAYLQGRNVPTRLGLRVSRDTFGRTFGGPGWGGPSDTGDQWSSAAAGAGSQSVGSGVGTHVVNAALSWQMSYLGDSYGDCQAAITGIWNMNVTGGPIEPVNLVQRYQPSGTLAGEHYMLRVSVSAAEVLTVAIWHSTLGVLSSTVTVATLTPGANSYRGKFQAEGQSLRGKVYPAGPSNDPDQFEPLDWQVSVHHERLTGGFPGVRTGAGAGNANVPITVTYDDWSLVLMRHTGELTKLQPTWDESHRIKRAAIKMADITQRLGRPQRAALSSAARRYLASNAEFTTTDHWPLDESATAPAQGLSATGGAPAIFQRETGVVPNRGAVNWGVTDRGHPAVPAFATLNNGGRLSFTTNTTSLGSSVSMMWAMRLSPDAGAQVFISTAGTANRWVFFFYTDGTYELFSNPTGTSLGTGVFAPGGLDGFWGTMGLTLFNNGGANVGYHFNVNGNTLGVGSYGGDPAYSAPTTILIHVPQPSTGGQGDSAFSSLFLTSARFDTVVSGKSIGYRAHWALMGWRGEHSGLRAYRLCAEEGVPFDYWDDLGYTRAMGAQRPIPLLDQLTECAEADGALLYAPRYTAGVAFRGRRAMTARSADATLAYSLGQVAPTFAMNADDRPTANLVRAERIGGGSLIVEQSTGPMNTGDPGIDPEAVGVVPADAKANVESDAQLGDVGGWVRALGTTPELRFPKVTVNLRAPGIDDGLGASVGRSVLALRPGDRLLVTGMTEADVYRDLDQLVRGGREVYGDAYQHSLTLNTSPYEKYRAGVYGATDSRYDGAGLITTLDGQLNSGVTGGRAVTTSAGPVWTTAAAAFPMDVIIGGERITVSGITGSGSAQTMTISARAVNGVAKTHPAGTRVYLHQPVYYS